MMGLDVHENIKSVVYYSSVLGTTLVFLTSWYYSTTRVLGTTLVFLTSWYYSTTRVLGTTLLLVFLSLSTNMYFKFKALNLY